MKKSKDIQAANAFSMCVFKSAGLVVGEKRLIG